MDALDHALTALREHEPGTIVGLTYHPDADPGDGSGWCCEVGDLHTYGQRDEAVTAMLARLGVAETEHADPIAAPAETTDRYWSYGPNGLDYHATADKARASAQADLDYTRIEAINDGWPDDVTRIAWGEIREAAVETDRGLLYDDDPDSDSDSDSEWVEYGLVPVSAVGGAA